MNIYFLNLQVFLNLQHTYNDLFGASNVFDVLLNYLGGLISQFNLTPNFENIGCKHNYVLHGRD
jgi:hypothetical protein